MFMLPFLEIGFGVPVISRFLIAQKIGSVRALRVKTIRDKADAMGMGGTGSNSRGADSQSGSMYDDIINGNFDGSTADIATGASTTVSTSPEDNANNGSGGDRLERFIAQLQTLESLLHDPTKCEFVIVTIPTEVATAESKRLLNR